MGILALFKSAAFAVLALAVSIGVIGKTKPELFLKLPMGFIPWAITGNIMPPYFDATPFGEDEFGTWTRDGDLIVSVGAKSGTNWCVESERWFHGSSSTQNCERVGPMRTTYWLEPGARLTTTHSRQWPRCSRISRGWPQA